MTPGTLYVIVGVTALLASAFGGWIGYSLASSPAAPAPTIIFQPGAIQVAPATPAAR